MTMIDHLENLVDVTPLDVTECRDVFPAEYETLEGEYSQ
jgi:hypothetical protein